MIVPPVPMAGDEVRDACPRSARQISGPGRLVVGQRVGRVVVLIGLEVLLRVLGEDLAAEPDGAVGALERVAEDDLGAEGAR